MVVAPTGRAKDLDERLASALASLGLAAGAEQRERILGYVALLQRWNAVHNLSAAQDPTTLLQQHVIDCLAIVRPLSRHAGSRVVRVLDAGTGGGLPATVLAIMQPDWLVTAVDSVGKKIAFLRQVVGELGLANLQPQQARLERMAASAERFDIVTSRAFSSLGQLVVSTRHLIETDGGVWAAMKGHPSEAELRQLPADCQLFHVEPLEVPGLEGQRCLAWIKPKDQTQGH